MKITHFHLARSETGVTAIEYGLLAALIAIAIVTAVTLVGTNSGRMFTGIASHLQITPAGGEHDN